MKKSFWKLMVHQFLHISIIFQLQRRAGINLKVQFPNHTKHNVLLFRKLIFKTCKKSAQKSNLFIYLIHFCYFPREIYFYFLLMFPFPFNYHKNFQSCAHHNLHPSLSAMLNRIFLQHTTYCWVKKLKPVCFKYPEFTVYL